MPFTSEQELATAVNSILAGLGDSSEKVAESLRGKGIRGERGKADQCPISKLLESEIGGAGWASVSACAVIVQGDSFVSNVQPPEPVAAFVSSFDWGEFPDLEAE
jgi:hypothetical protein